MNSLTDASQRRSDANGLDANLENVRREARREVACAKSQLALVTLAESHLESPAATRTSSARTELEAERDQRLAGAKTHISLAVNWLFDALAEKHWNLTRPDAVRFAQLSPTISADVESEIQCPDLAATIQETLAERQTSWAARSAWEARIRESLGWRELGLEFRSSAMQEEKIFPKKRDDQLLNAMGTYPTGNLGYGNWTVHGSHESLRMAYEAQATRAGIILGAPDGVEPGAVWLDSLFRDLVGRENRYLKYSKQREGGMIVSLFEASALYCMKLEKIALENEARLSARADESNKGSPHVSELMNLTDQQRELLRFLVAQHEPGGGEFLVTRSAAPGIGLAIGGKSFTRQNTVDDFWQLQEENLIRFSKTGANVFSGQLKQRGILAGSALSADEPVRIPPSIADQFPSQAELSDDQPVEANRTLAEERQAAVEDFLTHCQRETGVRVIKKHIWSAAGHKQPRQFQYWQAGQDRISGDLGTRGATEEDDRNFRRILKMPPPEFVSLLRKRNIVDDSQ